MSEAENKMTADEIAKLGPVAIEFIKRLKQIDKLDFLLDQLYAQKASYEKMQNDLTLQATDAKNWHLLRWRRS